jgi:hypothetical protein
LQQHLPKPEAASAWCYLLVTLEISLKIRRTTIHKLDFGGGGAVGVRGQITSSARVHLSS